MCWTTNGVIVFSGVLANPGLSIAGDAAGGADIAASTNDISARHVINTGALDSPALLCFNSDVQNFTSAAVTGGTTAIVTWWDGRNSVEGVYANQHTFSGPGSDPCPPSVAVPGEDLSTSSLELSRPAPNPASQGAAFAFSIPSGQSGLRYELGVFDVTGRRVRVVEHGVARAGRFNGRWDLSDDQGHRVSGGLYVLRLSIAGKEQTRTILVRH